jgi:hypothetical protein
VADTRLTLRLAAAVLGLSEFAIRKRVERGPLSSDKGPDGRRYVYLDTVEDDMADRGADASAPREYMMRSYLNSGRTTVRYESSWRLSAMPTPKPVGSLPDWWSASLP